MKIVFFILLFPFYYFSAQNSVLAEYPFGQHFYIGGQAELDKDLIKSFKALDLQKCPNVDEKYTVSILVEPDAKVKYIKDFDSINIQKNLCAYDLSRKIIPALTRWIPPVIDGKVYSGLAKIEINPFYFFYSKENPKDNVLVHPVYEKGLDSFMNKATDIFAVYFNGKESGFKMLDIVYFVTETGVFGVENIAGNISDLDKENLIKKLNKIKGKWIAGIINGIPVKISMKQRVSKKSDYY